MSEATEQTTEPEGLESDESTQDSLRKSIAARVQRVLNSDEGVKAMVNAVVPRELIASTLEQVDGARNEAVAIVGREMRNFLEHLDVGEELTKILTSVSFEVRLEVRFIPNEDGSLKASVRSSSRPKPSEDKKTKKKRKSADTQDQSASDITSDDAPEPKASAVQSESAEETELQDDSSANRRRILSRGTLTSMVQNVADVAATTARVAAEVAADAAAEVVNDARRRGEEHYDEYDDFD
ncbi:MAG TPA: hypothetical protein DCQ06_03570 [Myxococcales bacterium]|nr:hypothetical protein [Myxococcales bacterium]HAN30656.1 hypothetical protein [Myxococcales bacterium]|tara:strand:- start:438 stop:1154 length:717 start_codon:yes stop_codon:yes gene_type:complete